MDQHRSIIINGARENNLKNVDVEIPRNKITCLVGVSGSGKSSLAYNVIYAEGQRRFLESVSTYAARLLRRTSEASVDSIVNLSPTISIDQKRLLGSPRSTVGTATEIYTSLRLLFSRFGSEKGLSAGAFSFNNPEGACNKCKGLGLQFGVSPQSIADFSKSMEEGAIHHNNYKPGARLYNIIKNSKQVSMKVPLGELSEEEVNFLFYSPRVVLSNEDQGFIQTFSHEGIVNRMIKRAGDLRGGSASKEKKDRPYIEEQPCSECHGGRLNQKALNSMVDGHSIGELSTMQLSQLAELIKGVDVKDASSLIGRIVESLGHLIEVNLGYLSLNRGLDTLSGGEAQRLKLARELNNNLIEMVYVIDEPTSGLHPRDRANILEIIKSLRDKGNTVVMIEHDRDAMKIADYIVELGPGAGKYGGEIIAKGSFNEILTSPKSVTAKYLSEATESPIRSKRTPTGWIKVENASIHNLKNLTVEFPLGVLGVVTGVSGSGKSSLLIDVFAKENADKVILVDQKPMSGMARGNIATYTGTFDHIRSLFADVNGVSKSLFSFNSTGACPECKGLGYKNIDMHFMGDVKAMCETCFGHRYNEEVLHYQYKGKNMSEVLDMTVAEAHIFFEDKTIRHKLQTLIDVGLGYIELGQSHDTFSGGEAQRLKLATQLQRSGAIYVLDEPTAGLHYADIERLMVLLHRLVDSGNSVLAIEHKTDFITQADWVLELGPVGGDQGGKIIALDSNAALV